VCIAVVGLDGIVASRGDTARRTRWASVTKPVVTVAALVALEEGAVSLTDPAGPPGSTWHHLFAHTSGLPFDDGAPIARPGTKRIYSNSGWAGLAAHLEHATRFAMAEYLFDAVLAPLGMTDTALEGHPGRDGWGTLDDLAVFAHELLEPTLVHRTTLLSAASVQFPGLSGVLPGVGPFPVLDWGLGFQLNSSASMTWAGTIISPRTFGHFGATGSFVWVDPDRALAVCCLTDREFGPWALEVWPPLCDAICAEWDESRGAPP
jgi:CubicO group peptidase (beta-lactamase class C family)